MNAASPFQESRGQCLWPMTMSIFQEKNQCSAKLVSASPGSTAPQFRGTFLMELIMVIEVVFRHVA